MPTQTPGIYADVVTPYSCAYYTVAVNDVVVIDNGTVVASIGTVSSEVPLRIKVTCVTVDYDVNGNVIGGGPIGAQCTLYWDGLVVTTFSSYNQYDFDVPAVPGNHQLFLVLNIGCPQDSRCSSIGTCV